MIDVGQPQWLKDKLFDFTTVRLQEMDEAGVDIQVLSIQAPGTHTLDAEAAVRMARRANDHLHAAVSDNPDRFVGLPAAFRADSSDPRTACARRIA